MSHLARKTYLTNNSKNTVSQVVINVQLSPKINQGFDLNASLHIPRIDIESFIGIKKISSYFDQFEKGNINYI